VPIFDTPLSKNSLIKIFFFSKNKKKKKIFEFFESGVSGGFSAESATYATFKKLSHKNIFFF
jgi:hypothetical protein